MPSYLVETFLPRSAERDRVARERRVRSAAEELTDKGTRVHLDWTIHVPEDEICFFVFEASSREDAALAAELAAICPLRIVEAASFPNDR
jgi:hypothetical protein